jgi:hypothetical protein
MPFQGCVRYQHTRLENVVWEKPIRTFDFEAYHELALQSKL